MTDLARLTDEALAAIRASGDLSSLDAARVHWLGNATGMEARLVPPEGFALETIEFSGVRGKGALTLMLLPMRLLRGFWQSIRVLRRVRPATALKIGPLMSSSHWRQAFSVPSSRW